jgi:hypothetical protein
VFLSVFLLVNFTKATNPSFAHPNLLGYSFIVTKININTRRENEITSISAACFAFYDGESNPNNERRDP